MKLIADAIKMKEIDDKTIHSIKIPAMVLMERAAYSLAEYMKKYLKQSDRILSVCGTGNNGGDGIATARILRSQGYDVSILLIGDEQRATDQTSLQLEIARNLGIPMEINKLCSYNIIIDAIFGVGLTRDITGRYEEVINDMNSSENIVFSVDIPSGICATTGKVMNTAVRADHTVTFGYLKQGLLIYPGASYTGKIEIADIGFPDSLARSLISDTFCYEKEDIKRIPVRPEDSHKGTFGKVLMIAGSPGMSGAAVLSAKAAYRTGAGLVKVLTASVNRIILQTAIPEALFGSYDGTRKNDYEDLNESMKWATVIVIGPGLGQSDIAGKLLDYVLENALVPVIIDADALNLLAKKLDQMPCKEDQNSPQIQSRLLMLEGLLKEKTILTPHRKELSRLLNCQVKDIADNIIDTAKQCSYNSNLIYTIKDARTIVTYKNKKYINISGNNGMATGGSGDVLTGIIAALIAQGMEAYQATCLAVYLHGLSGDEAAKIRGNYSMIAGDIVDAISSVLHN